MTTFDFQKSSHLRRPSEFQRVYDLKNRVGDDCLLVFAAELGISRNARFKCSQRSLASYARSVLADPLSISPRTVGLYSVLETAIVDGRVYMVTGRDSWGAVRGVVFASTGTPPAPSDRLIEGPAYDLSCRLAAAGWWYFEQHPRHS